MLFKKKGLELDKKYGYFLINGKFYEFTTKDGQPVLIEVTKKAEQKEKDAKQIVEKIKYGLDAEKLLMERIMDLPNVDFRKLKQVVFHKKRKFGVKTRAHHCVDMKIGNYILPLEV